ATPEQLGAQDHEGPANESLSRRSAWFRLGLRSRQIALITVLVAVVVTITAAVNVAHLTDVIVRQTGQEVEKLSQQIKYAVQQELAGDLSEATPNYGRLAAEHSGVRSLMESTIVSSRTISYIYLTNPDGEMITDSEGRYALVANRYLVDSVGSPPAFGPFADQNGYFKLVRILFAEPIYEYRSTIDKDSLAAELRVGVSMSGIQKQLYDPIIKNLVIGFIAIVFAAVVAISSANLLLRPLQAISTSIQHL